MNKKFSTLAVAAMLASAFTAYAGPGEVVTKLAEGNNGKAYQLVAKDGDDYKYLVLNGKQQLELRSSLDNTNVTEESYTLGGSLWCVNVTLENDGKTIIYDFTNKAHGDVLDLTVGGYNTDWDDVSVTDVFLKKLDHVGGEVSGWAFAPTLGKTSNDPDDFMFNASGVPTGTLSGTLSPYALRSYINSNLVATLVKNSSDEIYVAVLAPDNLNSIAPGNTYEEIQFFLKEADPVDLTAEQFNTVLHTQKEDYIKLSFDKDYNNTDIINLFSTNELKAENDQVVSDGTNNHNFVNLYKTNADGTNNYLRVDTAYANDYGINFLKFAFSGNNDKIAYNAANNPIKNQYNFRLNYCPTDDSLSIQVQEVYYLREGEKWWNTVDNNGNLTGINSSAVEKYTWTGSAADPDAATGTTFTQNWVKLQDLVASQEIRIVTVGNSPINTHISFGFGDCTAVKSEYTSVADGVYYIKNAKGQYLTYPIYVDNGGKPQFVTVNAAEQDVAHMPAFQWVVLKNYTDAGAPTSPVKIANREFQETTTGSVQLKKAAGATYMYAQGNELASVAVDSLEFVAVPQESIKDPYLGYKKLTKEELQVNKYTFNYWHPYATDKYIALAEGDSIFTVWDEISAFNIDTIAYNPNIYRGNFVANTNYTAREVDENGTWTFKDQPTVDIAYGYDPADAKTSDNKERIPGLAQLVRTAYQVSLNGTEWKVNQNDQFNIGKNSWAYGQSEDKGVQSVDKYVVFFKENMHVNGQHYYAILKASNEKYNVGVDKDGKMVAPNTTGLYEIAVDKYPTLVSGTTSYVTNTVYVVDGEKAGVSDYDGSATLKNQPIVETRTSSFAINPDDTPLYRRFNSTLEGIAGDGADTLRFYEKYRNEYLMVEANPSFMVAGIDFLGINAQDKADGGLAFIVDTAWVNRGAGNIKPQYLISIDRHDFAGTPGVPCVYEHNHYDNEGVVST